VSGEYERSERGDSWKGEGGMEGRMEGWREERRVAKNVENQITKNRRMEWDSDATS
jgi:hypothetical protein